MCLFPDLLYFVRPCSVAIPRRSFFFLWETEELTWERGKGGGLEGVEGGESVVRMYETRMRVQTVITTQPISKKKKNPPVTIVLIMLHIT